MHSQPPQPALMVSDIYLSPLQCVDTVRWKRYSLQLKGLAYTHPRHPPSDPATPLRIFHTQQRVSLHSHFSVSNSFLCKFGLLFAMRPVTCYFPIKAGQEGKRCVIHFPHAKHVARKSRWVGTSGEASGGELVGTSGETSGLPLVGRRLNLSEPESIPVMIPVPRSTRHLPGETYPLDK